MSKPVFEISEEDIIEEAKQQGYEDEEELQQIVQKVRESLPEEDDYILLVQLLIGRAVTRSVSQLHLQKE